MMNPMPAFNGNACGAPSAQWPPTVPGYTIRRFIGRGGMGDVYLAHQESLGRDVAIKFLNNAYHGLPEERIERFRREARLMARVNHPNIVAVYDFEIIADHPCIIMEYVEGGDLRHLMQPGVPLEPGRAGVIVRDVGRAMQCLHRHEILHRDMKPENILLAADGTPKLADFGIAVIRGAIGELTRTSTGMGTLGYISPEQQYRLKVDERSDQYSLAALAYEMISGYVPYGVIRPPSTYNGALSPRIDSVLMRALDEDPALRFEDLAAFLDAFGEAIVEPHPTPEPVVPRRPAWQPIAAVASAALVALLGAMVIVRLDLSSRRSDGPIVETPEPRADEFDGGDPPSPVPPGDFADDPSPMLHWDDEPAPDVAPDRLTVLLETQIERNHRALEAQSGGSDRPDREQWLNAVRLVLGHGPLASQVEERIKEMAYRIWQAKGEPEGTELEDWLDARDTFLDRNMFNPLIDASIGQRAYQIFEDSGGIEDRDRENWIAARNALIDEGALLPAFLLEEDGFATVLVPAGEFATDRPERRVRVSEPFYLAVQETTVRWFSSFVAASNYRTAAEREGDAIGFEPEGEGEVHGPESSWRNPGYLGGPAGDHPVVQVTVDDAMAFCRWFSEKYGASYRLPTADEWDLALHRGTALGCPADTSRPLDEHAWFLGNSDARARPVGAKAPTVPGLNDLLGNVAEWCLDVRETTDAAGPEAVKDPGFVAKGGSWVITAEEIEGAAQPQPSPNFRDPSIGFRVLREVPDVR